MPFPPPESGHQSGNSQMSHETASHDSKTIFYLKCESQEICSWKIACSFFFFFLAAGENFNIIFGKIRLLFYKTHLSGSFGCMEQHPYMPGKLESGGWRQR